LRRTVFVMKLHALFTPFAIVIIGATALPVPAANKGIDWKRNEFEERGGGGGKDW